MTCRGYDPKTVKLGKPIKQMAATITDKTERGYFIKMFVDVLKEDAKSKNSRGK